MNRQKVGSLQEKLTTLLRQWNLQLVIEHIIQLGGKVYVVGGAVRDLILQQPIHELDIEVHALPLETLITILRERGMVNLVGKSFGVLKIEGIPVDWSLPRSDTEGRKPRVAIDPFMAIQEALRRRDLTMNAMAIDVQTMTLIDPFNGKDDIAHERLRTPNPSLFVEDPLRFYRVMQFIGRFSMMPDKQLNEVCTAIDVKGVSQERIEEEMRKLFLKSSMPSRGLRWVASLGRMAEIFPELARIEGLIQDPIYHPEGDVFEHTMQALDAAAELSYDSDKEKLIILYAALCHDLGKASTTTQLNGRIRSIGHEQVSAHKAASLLKKIVGKKDLIEAVKRLVAYHLAPIAFITQNSSPVAYKRLALKLAPYTNLYQLALLSLADRRGRNPQKHVPLDDDIPEINLFLEKARAAGVLFQPEEPLLKGRDFLDVVSKGPLLGKLVKQAYGIQINKGIIDKNELKKRVLSGIKKHT